MKVNKIKISQVKRRIAAFAPVVRIRTSAAGKLLEKGRIQYRANPLPVHFLLVLLFRAVLDFVYITQMSPLYAYAGFTTQIIPLTYAVSWMIMIVASPMVVYIQRQEHTPSAVLITCLNYLYFIPMTSLCGCKGLSVLFSTTVLLYWTIILILQIKIPVLQLNKCNVASSNKIFQFLTIFSIIFIMGVSGYYTGFRLKLNMQDVYSVRAEAADYDIPGIISYVLSWMTVILSVLILYWMQKKRWLVAILLFVTYLFYYSISASKSVFLLLFLLVGVYFFYRSWMLRWIAPILSIGALGCWLIARIGNYIMPLSLFVRRMMYVPVNLSASSWEFIQNNCIDVFRDSILGKLGFHAVYSIGYARVLGEYVGTPQTNCNNGLIGDMSFNLPILAGVVLMPLLLILCFRLLDLASTKFKPHIFIGICVYCANSFCNSTWSTVLLTHGYLILCVLLYLFPSTEEKLSNEVPRNNV